MHGTWEEQFRHQEERGALAADYWRLAAGRPGARVADVGCGAGYFALRYAALTGPTGHVHATDAAPEALGALRARLDPVHHAHLTTEVLDIVRAPLPDLHFDAVLCTDALHHIPDVVGALRHMRVGRPRLVIAEFDPEGPGDIGPDHEERLAPEALERALVQAGWRPEKRVPLAYEHYAVAARVA